MMQRTSPDRLLDEYERKWSPLLRGVSLVVEAGISADERAPAVAAIGPAYRLWCGKGRRPDRFFENWAACVAVTVSGVAAEKYEKNTFWPYLWRKIGLPQGRDAEWGHGFAAAVSKLNMPGFPGMRRSLIGPILMHAGIPDYCLDDYFRLIAQRRAADPGLSAEHFLEWALAEEDRLKSLDVPARQFLTCGTEFSYDFVERTFDLLDRSERGEEDLSTVGLPSAVVEKARGKAVGPAGGRALPLPERPRIVLDPFGQGVQVELPPVETDDGVACWEVNTDGVIAAVRGQVLWPGLAESVPAATFALSIPVRTVVVSLVGEDYRLAFDVVDPAAPLIVFDERGQWLPARLPLPSENVWVLHPDDTGLEVSGGHAVLDEVDLPLGWRGWRLRRISLAEAGSLALAGMPATSRPVRGSARPRLLGADPVPGLSTPYGRPVVAAPPSLWLPGSVGTAVRWTIEIRARGADKPVLSRTETVVGEKEITDLWSGIGRPLLGEFEVTVRGPLGRALREVVFLAEGARAEFEPTTRVFEEAGLAAGRTRLKSATDAGFEHETLDFASDVRELAVEYRATGGSVPLVVRPPHMAVLHEGGKGAGWRTGPLRLETDRLLDEAGALVVHLPGVGRLRALRMTVKGETVQELPSSGPVREGRARYDLRKAKDTLARHGRAELVLDVMGGGVIPVATVRPRRPATGVVHEVDALRLIDAVDGLTAGVYVLHAPWREPRVIPVAADGRIPLSAELAFAGPLLVFLQIDDSWAPVSWPRWPERYLMAVPEGDEKGYPKPEGDVPGRELSRFVVGERSMPEYTGGMRRVWSLYTLADRLPCVTRVFAFRQSCAKALCRSPEASLIALGEFGLSEEDLAAALIGSGVSTFPPLDSRSALWLWALAPAVAALLGNLRDEATLAAARKHCGPAEFDELRETGTDPLTEMNRFGDEVEEWLRMAPEQLDVVWRVGRVPQPVLTAEARRAASRQVFLGREDPAVKAFGAAAPSIVGEACRSLPDSGVLRRFDGRAGAAGWRQVPAASAALAVMARRAARGDERCGAVEERYRGVWASFAAIAPRLVLLDLVVAELLLSR